MNRPPNRRILLIDDLPSIHQDFRKILSNSASPSELDDVEAALFGTAAKAAAGADGFELDSAYQGQEGVAKVSESLRQGLPYAMAFVDMRMPPGWDGVETVRRLWQEDPRLQIVICTAYSDYSWDEVVAQLDVCDRLLILKKPFDNIEVAQLANALTKKWDMTQQAEVQRDHLEEQVRSRTAELKHANEALLEQVIERKLAEQALRLKHEAIEASINGIFLINNRLPDNPIEYVNPAFERITGYASDEVKGRNIRCLLGEDQDQPGIRAILEVMRDGREGHEVLRSYRKDGTPFWSECYVAGIRDNSEEITHFVVILNDISEAKRLEELLHNRANYDTLTKLPNRLLMMDRIAEAVAKAQRENGRVAVAFVDLDRFKFINDSLGHDAGDVLLQEIARRLCECVRESDTVARLGGDEFVILMEMAGDVSPVMQRIVDRIGQPVTLAGEEHAVTCSIGVSVYPQDGRDAETLLKNADTAMYQAKEIGRNSFQFFKDDMNARLNERILLETDLRHAMERGEFELYYQPVIELRGGTIIGFEALIRWHHPSRGLVLPNSFIPIAEQSDLILRIGEWVLRQACTQNQTWVRAGISTVPVLVNLSARQFDRQDIVRLVQRVLLETGLAPGLLELEITETLSMQEPRRTIEFIEKLKAIGVKVAIDDFGTGYSNLTYLKKFPVDKLKLDSSFMSEITSNKDSMAIASAVIDMGHSLNLTVVAEGVEQESQLSLLCARGCDLMQGHLFSPALPADEFAALVRSGRKLVRI
ncbi:EAL domain-containing protein [Burkholderia ubonensis]|uniref:Diguanylate cyclase n=1 Tax=Burkholderia ubonensis TaxID=101571 RepID=A0A107FTB3_9BURK|nr:EAL domain-containing protein [Burkholderia ubonensis]AOK61613.1 hypothetical protein WM29_20840 [Burkholderia ubonensis]KVS39053.1 hypothetical protein WK37_25760 [Burkholderia ubonensis]KVS46503.1 hypothetical protein WK38_00510 [Burkholderia ubonensis]KVS83919.1 hypothetical protein WK42_07155 [Burkholderia ubonensis]KVS92647.1 hypothetical protein WK44_11540 [Burkholderia ubonensis]